MLWNIHIMKFSRPLDMWIQRLGMVKAADKNLGWKLKSRDKIKMWTNLKQERKEV